MNPWKDIFPVGIVVSCFTCMGEQLCWKCQFCLSLPPGDRAGRGKPVSPTGSCWQWGLALTLQVLVGESPPWTPACTAATDEIQWLDFRSRKCESSGTCCPKAKFDAILGGGKKGRKEGEGNKKTLPNPLRRYFTLNMHLIKNWIVILGWNYYSCSE